MSRLWTCSVNIDTLEITRNVSEGEEYDGYPEYNEQPDGIFEAGAGYATYNDDGFRNVYAESLVSQEEADRLVYMKCHELSKKFEDAFFAVMGAHSNE